MLCGDWHSCLPEDRLFFVAGVALGEACTIVLRGATQQILDEAERSLHDALCVLAQTVKETRTVYGGGRLGVQSWFCCSQNVLLVESYYFQENQSSLSDAQTASIYIYAFLDAVRIRQFSAA